jgi:5-methyltetrahydropteroyltriglutamate--homocysteine methyltransferase
LHYDKDQTYLDAPADAMAREYKAIVDSGLILQIDAPDLTTMFRLTHMTPSEHQTELARRVDAINRAVRDLSPDRIRVHVCWGIDEAPHNLDVPLKDIVNHLLRLRPRLATPGSNGRHSHEWRVWQDTKLPDDKALIPGVTDSTTNIIEHPEVLAERIVRYSETTGPEPIIAGVDCGFGSVAQVGQVDSRIVTAKLRSLAEGADIATGQLSWRELGRLTSPSISHQRHRDRVHRSHRSGRMPRWEPWRLRIRRPDRTDDRGSVSHGAPPPISRGYRERWAHWEPPYQVRR